MAHPKAVTNYPGSQAELYSVCRTGWNNYLMEQLQFEELNTSYTVTFGNDNLNQVIAAEQLPDFQERDELSESARIQLKEAHAPLLTVWKKLRSHIKHAFPENLHKPKIESAGSDHYPKAANFNWSETRSMVNSGQNFLDNNTPILTAGGMPAAFITQYSDARTAFINLFDTFIGAEQAQHLGTADKINANNAIFKNLNKMFEDGKLIFEHNPEKRDLFTFATIRDLITTTATTAGTTTIPADTFILSGTVTEATTATPIEGAALSITTDPALPSFTAVSQADGTFTITVSGLPTGSTGTTDLNVEALDFDPATLPINYETGKAATIDIQLNPTPVPPLP